MHAPPQFLFDGLQLNPHAIPPGLPFDLEFSPASFVADEDEAQEGEGLRFAKPAPLAVFRRKSSELDEPGLLRMKRQRKLLQPLTHRIEEAPGVNLVLKTDNKVVGIAHDDHVARGFAPSPAFGPKVEDVMQVDVAEQRRDHRALPRPPLTDRRDPVFQDARLQPFLDQADDALVADTMFQETDQPLLADFVEERSNVGVQYPVHLRALDPDNERIQRIVRAAPRSKSEREPEEVFLVDRVEHRNCRPLDDLVLQGGNRERALFPSAFGMYVRRDGSARYAPR